MRHLKARVEIKYEARMEEAVKRITYAGLEKCMTRKGNILEFEGDLNNIELRYICEIFEEYPYHEIHMSRF